MPYKDHQQKLEYDRKYKEDRKMRGYCSCGNTKEDRRRKWCYSCKPLFDKYTADKEYRTKHPEKIKGYARTYNQKVRWDALLVYSNGNPKCACCGESQPEFLALDHINGGGSQHRKEINHNIFSWLKTNGYPTGFRVLCHNCNMSRGFYGYCPHETQNGLPATVGINSLLDDTLVAA